VHAARQQRRTQMFCMLGVKVIRSLGDRSGDAFRTTDCIALRTGSMRSRRTTLSLADATSHPTSASPSPNTPNTSRPPGATIGSPHHVAIMYI
jgi:hypothetical protein